MAAPSTAHALFADAALWDDHDPDYVAIAAIVGDSNEDRASTQRAVVNLAKRTPVALAFQLDSDTNSVYVGHSPTIFVADILHASPYDNKTIVMVGDDLSTATPVALHPDAFTRTANAHLYNLGYLQGPNGHGAAPPVFRFDHNGAGGADTSQHRVRRAMVLPPSLASNILEQNPTGVLSLLRFCNTIVAPAIAAGGAAAARMAPVREWYRAGCTNTAAGAPRSVIEVAQVTSANPVHNQRLAAHSRDVLSALRARLGDGGPSLTTAAFNRGVQDLTTTMSQTTRETLTYHREAARKSFTSTFGASLCARMMRLTGSAAEADLPDVHNLVASAAKHNQCSVVQAQLDDRTSASLVPLSHANRPLVTTSMMDTVYRSFQPSSSGLTFGQGLSPFAVVCEGHKEAALVLNSVKRAELVESGAGASLDDASSILSVDVRLATEATVAAEKLYGWSVHLDVFHGTLQPVAARARQAVLVVGPALSQLARVCDNPAEVADFTNRVLYEIQQEYFGWCNKMASRTAGVDMDTAPDYSRVTDMVLTYRAQGLSPLPSSWCLLFRNVLRPAAAAPAAASPPGPRQRAVGTSSVNPHADSRLMQRFRDSEFTNVRSLQEAAPSGTTVPQHRGQEVCLTWALKGECNETCRRAGCHCRYGRDTIAGLHRYMDACGVPGAAN